MSADGANDPTRGARLLAAFVAARVGFGLAYLVSSLRPTALFWYHPLLRAWTLEVRPADFAMDWYGRTALALVAAALLGAGTFAAGAKGPFARALARPSFVLGLAHAAALVVLVDFVYFGWVLTHQTPAPLPLPSWYCPR